MEQLGIGNLQQQQRQQKQKSTSCKAQGDTLQGKKGLDLWSPHSSPLSLGSLCKPAQLTELSTKQQPWVLLLRSCSPGWAHDSD